MLEEVQVVTREDGQTGILVNGDEQAVVIFQRPAKPRSVVWVRAKRQMNGTYIVHDGGAARIDEELLVADGVAEAVSDYIGLYGQIDTLRWDESQQSSASFPPGAPISDALVPRSEVSRYITHYTFQQVEAERRWLADRLVAAEDPRVFAGRPVKLSPEVRSWLADVLGADAATLEERQRALEQELARVQRQVRAERAQQHTAQRELKGLEETLASRRNEVASIIEEHDYVDAQVKERQQRRDELDRELVELEASIEAKRVSLSGDLAALEERRTHLVEVVQHLEVQEGSGVSPRDPVAERTVEQLGPLPELVDENEALKELVSRLGERAAPEVIVALHVALKHFPFLVLTGPSGTGKSSLLRKYAEALGFAHEVIPVQPHWTTGADLHGYVFPLGETRHFITTRFSRLLGMQLDQEPAYAPEANAARPLMCLAVLDEINLAHVEYYLSDYLSALEDDRTVSLANRMEIAHAVVPFWLRRGGGEVTLPPSFLIAGTANEDHTTRGFSDKFRDRAALLELPALEYAVGETTKSARLTQSDGAIGRVSPQSWSRWRQLPSRRPADVVTAHKKADEVLKVFRAAGMPVGYRIARDVEVFISAAAPHLKQLKAGGKAHAEVALDLALAMRVLQKYLPMMSSRTDMTEESRRRVLRALQDKLKTASYCTRLLNHYAN